MSKKIPFCFIILALTLSGFIGFISTKNGELLNSDLNSPLSAVDRENFAPQTIRSESVDINAGDTYVTSQMVEEGDWYCIVWHGSHDYLEVRVAGKTEYGDSEGNIVWRAASTSSIGIEIEDYSSYFFPNSVSFEILKSEVDNLPDGYYGDWDTPIKYDKFDGRYFKRHIVESGEEFEINTQNPQLYVYGYISFSFSDPITMSFRIMVVDAETDDVVFYNRYLLSSSYVEEEYDLKALNLPSGTYRVYIEASSRFTVKPFTKSGMMWYKIERWGIILGIVGGIIGIPVLLCKMSTRQKKPKAPKKPKNMKTQKTHVYDPLAEVQTTLASVLGAQGQNSTNMGITCYSCGHRSAPGQRFCSQCGKKL